MVPSIALRQAGQYLGLVYALTTAIALAMPHSAATPILSLFTPVISVVIVSFVAVPRGERRSLWRDVGFRHAGIRTWPSAVALPLVFLSVAYGGAIAVGVGHLEFARPLWPAVLRAAPDVAISLVIGTVIILGE